MPSMSNGKYNHFSVSGFKRRKSNKRTKTLFITTTLSMGDIEAAMKKCGYCYGNITNVDSFTDNPRSWLRPEDIDLHLDMFTELRIVGAISR